MTRATDQLRLVVARHEAERYPQGSETLDVAALKADLDRCIGRDVWLATALSEARDMLAKWRAGYSPDMGDLATIDCINLGYEARYGETTVREDQ